MEQPDIRPGERLELLSTLTVRDFNYLSGRLLSPVWTGVMSGTTTGDLTTVLELLAGPAAQHPPLFVVLSKRISIQSGLCEKAQWLCNIAQGLPLRPTLRVPHGGLSRMQVGDFTDSRRGFPLLG